MASDISYEHPAVTEAVCEFRFLPTGPWDGTVPGLAYQQLSGLFPTKVTGQRFRVQPDAQGPPEVHIENLVRLNHRDHRERAFVQISTHYLSVHNAGPYLGWRVFEPLIRETMDAYVRIANPTGFQRLGLRYINRIEPPRADANFSEYLTFYPHLGPQLPQHIGPFNMLITTPVEGRPEENSLRLALRSDDAARETPAILLDLDYFTSEPGSVNIADGLDWVNAAHEWIRSTFENCLTSEMKERLGRRPSLASR